MVKYVKPVKLVKPVVKPVKPVVKPVKPVVKPAPLTSNQRL